MLRTPDLVVSGPPPLADVYVHGIFSGPLVLPTAEWRPRCASRRRGLSTESSGHRRHLASAELLWALKLYEMQSSYPRNYFLRH